MRQSAGDILARFSPVLLTLLLALSSYWISVKSELSLFDINIAQDPQKPDYFFKGFASEQHKRTDNSVTILTGVSAEHIPGPKLLNIQSPTALQLDSAGQQLRMTGDSGVYHTENDTLLIQGDVDIHAHRGLRIKTETLRSDNKTGLLSSEAKTVITQPSRTLTMEGFEYASREGHLVGNKAVTLTLEPN